MPETRDYKIAAVDRALLVLEALADRPKQGVTELSKRLGLTKTIVFRLLSTLEARGFVMRDEDKAVFSLGYRVGVLGERAGAQNTLLSAARPIMQKLRDETSENINLIIREGLRSLVLATFAGHHSMRIFANPGRYGPLHAGGGSLLLLAHASDDVVDGVLAQPLDRFTPSTITAPRDLRKQLAMIRSDGFHIAVNDLDEGAFSVAAPIWNASDEVIAALSIAGAMARYDETKRRAYLEYVQDATAQISGKLGLLASG